MNLDIAIASILSFSLTLVLILKGRNLAMKLKLMDVPGGRKKHLRPTPLLGGLALILIIVPMIIIYTIIYSYYFQSAIFGVVGVSCIIALVAVFDDRAHISPITRIMVSVVLFGTVMWQVPSLQIGVISWNGAAGYISLGRFTFIFTVVSLIALINAINMADGKNGLVTGLCLGFSIILLIGARAGLEPIIAVLVGSTLALFLFNIIGRLFLGDGGSYGLAALIGLFAIYEYQRSDILNSADQVGLMFMIPVCDMSRLMIARIRAGHSPFEPDRNHLHHMLQDQVGWRNGLLVYWGLVFIPTITALIVPDITLFLIFFSILSYLSIIYLVKLKNSG